MKKVLVAAATAAVLTISPVALSSATAAPAAPAASAQVSVYPDSVKTKTKVKVAKKQKKRIRKGKRGTIKINVRAGNAKPTGQAVVTVKGKKGYTKRIKAAYKGAVLKVRLPKLPRGDRYTIRTKFKAPGSSVYQNSSGKLTIRVKKK